MERKRLIELIGSIFVAIIFLTSYASFGNKIISNKTTVTTSIPQTIYATAQGNAIITSYGSMMRIDISCQNVTSVSKPIDNLLTAMESNGSVGNFYSQQAAQILVQSGKLGTYAIYNTLSQGIGNSMNCTDFSSSAGIALPSKLDFYLPEKKNTALITIPNNFRNYSVSIKFMKNMSNKLNVSVATMLTSEGIIYGNMSVQVV